MAFHHQGTVSFHDTDAAGVVYFAHILVFCHTAYEASLQASGIDLHRFFSGDPLAVPIVHAEVDFALPLHCGDRYRVELSPHLEESTCFQIQYQLLLGERLACRAQTRHICINPKTRQRHPLTPDLLGWIQQWEKPEVPAAEPAPD